MKNFVRKIKIDVPEFDIIIIISNSTNEVEKIINNFVKNAEEKESLKKELFETINEECEGSYWKVGGSRFLLLTSWKNDWEHWDTLNHEVNHLVEKEAKDRFFDDEEEFKAYMQEGLFRKFRGILAEYK